MKVSVDFETRSPVDIRKHGAYRYFEHPEAKVLMAAYRIDDGPLKCWTWLDDAPDDLFAAIRGGAMIHAWNAQFETLGFECLTQRESWPMPRYDQFVDTAAAAAAMSLPRALGDAAQALGLEIEKDKDGMRLIRKFSIPRRDGGWNEPADHPEDWQKFIDYCKRDVEVEERIAKRILPLSAAEQKLWWLDQTINRRGIRIDRASAVAAVKMAEKAKTRLDREMTLVTGGYVRKCSEPGKLVEWVQEQGVALTSAAKAEITDLLECDDLPSHVRKALEIRQEAAKTSVAKLNAMLDRASSDGRVRGSFLYHGASTGRWSNTGVNFANMPRPRRIFDDEHPRTDVLFRAIRSEDPELLGFLYGADLGRPLHLLSDAIRGFIWAAPGHELMQADYSGIEGAVIAWLASEDWKLEVMHQIIADPAIPDLYRQTAAKIMNMSTDVITKKHWLRQAIGKPAELSLGFQGFVAALYAMARGYGVNFDDVYAPVWEAASEELREKALKRYETCLKRGEAKADVLSREAWLACALVVYGWRLANPAIAQSWKDLDVAIREAIQNPGQVTRASKVDYVVAHGFLFARLPSGRCLAYGAPRLKELVWVDEKIDGEWVSAGSMDREDAEKLERIGTHRINGPSSPKATALGVNSVTKKWERFALYGGLAMENCLSGDTDVLTPYGWKRITDIQPTDMLWDGLEWVRHDGLVCQGSKMTIDISGVRMTPEHKVWTNDGWVRADRAAVYAVEAASPDPEFDRAALRAAAGGELCGRRREEGLVVGPMRLRHDEVVRRFGVAQREDTQLRVLREGTLCGTGDEAWPIAAQAVRGVEQHARSVPSAVAFCLRAVRRAWHYGLRSVDEVRAVLLGHGAHLARRAYAGAEGQQRRLFAHELRVGGSESASAEQAKQHLHQHAERAHVARRGCGDQRYQHHDAVLSSRGGVASEVHVPAARLLQEGGRVELVYDILNAGPRHRFTVRGATGPIIVSNCTQAVARDLLVNGMWKAEEAGYPIIATVYDEMICEVPRGFGDLKTFEKIICELPDWAAGLPLTAGGWRKKRYCKE